MEGCPPFPDAEASKLTAGTPVAERDEPVRVDVVDTAKVVGTAVGSLKAVLVSELVLVRMAVIGDGNGVGSTGTTDMVKSWLGDSGGFACLGDRTSVLSILAPEAARVSFNGESISRRPCRIKSDILDGML